MLFIIKGFQTIVISTTFRSIYPPAFFRRLLNSGTFTELWTMSFIESTRVACSDSVSNNQVQVLSIPVLLLGCSNTVSSRTHSIRVIGIEEGWRTYQPKCRGNNKDENNSLQTLNDKIIWNLDNKHLKTAEGHIGQNNVEITIKMKTIVQKPLMIKIIKLHHRNLDKKHLKKAGGYLLNCLIMTASVLRE